MTLTQAKEAYFKGEISAYGFWKYLVDNNYRVLAERFKRIAL